MATLTPNLGLTLPAGDENVSRQVINDNMMIIDNAAGNNSSLDAMQEGLTNIVDGDTTDEAIPAGAYAYLKNNTHGLAEGYYQNISGSAFPTSGGTASITTFAPVSTAGILNSLNNKLNGEPITITPTSGFTLSYNYSKKIGNNMFLVFGVSKSSGYVGQETWTTIATVQGLGIERSIVVPAAPYGTNSSARMEIYPNGDIKFIVLSSTCNGGNVNAMLPANS